MEVVVTMMMMMMMLMMMLMMMMMMRITMYTEKLHTWNAVSGPTTKTWLMFSSASNDLSLQQYSSIK